MKPLGNYKDGRRAPAFRHIAEYFLKPLMKLKPKNTDATAWLSSILHVEARNITTWVATKRLKLPGTFKQTATRTVPGIGNRNVYKGDTLWVRTDATNLDAVEVEVVNRKEDENYLQNTPRWFVLTRADWLSIRQWLEKK